MLSHYDTMQARPARPAVPATPEAAQRRAKKLAFDRHTTATPTARQQRKALRSREKALLRELQPIQNELDTVRQQLAAL